VIINWVGKGLGLSKYYFKDSMAIPIYRLCNQALKKNITTLDTQFEEGFRKKLYSPRGPCDN
jgi:hypothetical protein